MNEWNGVEEEEEIEGKKRQEHTETQKFDFLLALCVRLSFSLCQPSASDGWSLDQRASDWTGLDWT